MLVVRDWLQDFITEKLSSQAVEAALEAGGVEIESAQASVLNVTTPANRSDLQSVIGLAREVAAHSGAGLKTGLDADLTTAAATIFTNHIKAAVPRYSLSRLKLKRAIKPSPKWLRHRLELSGIRPINNVVDITNYIMLAYGQPLHAFDQDKIVGKLAIRYAKADETLLTLDGVTRKLESNDIIIADDTGVIDLGGVMGGADSEISASTKSVLLEAATFNNTSVRKTALRLGLRTEASARFERGLPVELAPIGQKRAVQLLDELIGIDLESIEDQVTLTQAPRRAKLETTRIGQLAGLEIKPEQVISSLRKLEFQVKTGKDVKKTSIIVTPPYWRQDIKEEADIFEEVIKFVGLDKIPAKLPKWQPTEVRPNDYWPKIWQLRHLLQGVGLFEVATYPFISVQQLESLGFDPTSHLKLRNPRSSEQAYLRSSLLPNLLEAIRRNNKYRSSFTLFEMARVFLPISKQVQPDEPLRLGVISCSPKGAYCRVKNVLDNLGAGLQLDFAYQTGKKQAYLHPQRQINIFINGEQIGFIGEIQPQLLTQLKVHYPVAYLELDTAPLLRHTKPPAVVIPSRFQSATRDITAVVKSAVPWSEIRKVLQSRKDIQINYVGDYYGNESGEDQRALTLRITIMAVDHNLTEAEIGKNTEGVANLLRSHFNAVIKD